MIKLLSSFLSLFAPWARARHCVSEQQLGCSYSKLVDLISKELPVKKANENFHCFRVKGDFFAPPEATLVVLGAKADPAHFSNIGFNLIIKNLGKGQIQLIAEERVILGYLEVKAASVALTKRLQQIIRYIAEETKCS